MSEQRKFRVTKKHSRQCRAMGAVRDGRWDSPWYFVGAIVYRTIYGTDGGPNRRGAHHRWHVLQCNATNCNAAALLHEDVLMDALFCEEAP